MCQKYRQKSPVKKNINSKSQDVRKCGCVGGWGGGQWALSMICKDCPGCSFLIISMSNYGFILMVPVHVTEDVVNSIPVASGDIDIK